MRLLSVFGCAFALASCSSPDLVTLRSVEASPSALARDAEALLEFECHEALALLEEHARRAESAARAAAVDSPAPSFDVAERIGWLCRLVFVDAEGRPVRAPMRGGVSLPYLSMPAESWPHFPLAVEGGCIFVLAEGLTLAGFPEPMSDYFTELRKVARKTAVRYAQPSRQECERAFEQLLASARWRSIRWSHESPNYAYAYHEESVRQEVLRRF